MSTDSKPFNPTWVTAGILVLLNVASIGATFQANSETRSQVTGLQSWQMATEKRLADNERKADVATVTFQKDLDALGKGVQAIQNALMVRPAPK